MRDLTGLLSVITTLLMLKTTFMYLTGLLSSTVEVELYEQESVTGSSSDTIEQTRVTVFLWRARSVHEGKVNMCLGWNERRQIKKRSADVTISFSLIGCTLHPIGPAE